LLLLLLWRHCTVTPTPNWLCPLQLRSMCGSNLLVLLLGLLDAVHQQRLQIIATAQLSCVGGPQLPQLLALTLQGPLQLLQDALIASIVLLLLQVLWPCSHRPGMVCV
jgi:hypothetical protein